MNQIPAIRQHSKQTGDCFEELAHYLGRLGAHVYAVKVIVAAALKVPSVKQIVRTCKEDVSEARRFSVGRERMDPYEIVKGICLSQGRGDLEAAKYLSAYVLLDIQRDFKKLMEERGGTVVSRVHCELMLLDRFSRRQFEFVGRDKYIGCSKGACYFCLTYIKMHHKDFVIPATHNKVLTHVRGPEPNPQFDVNGNGEKLMKMMEEKMNWALDQDILDALVKPDSFSIPAFRHCSTNGSSMAPSVVTHSSGR
jgi:OTT_1508-like deaminase